MADKLHGTEQGQCDGTVNEERLHEPPATGHLGSAGAAEAPLPLSQPSAPPPLDTPSLWHYACAGQRSGPISQQQLQQLLAAGQLKPTDLAWKKGMTQWVPLSQVIPAAAPPHAPTQNAVLDRCYLPFLITLIVIFSAGLPSLGFSYYFGFFAVAIGFAVCNFLAGMNNKLGTAPWDLIIMILAVVSLIPYLGWLAQMAALAFCIVALLKYVKRLTATACAS